MMKPLPPRLNLKNKLHQSLRKTRQQLTQNWQHIFGQQQASASVVAEKIEELLIAADIGITTTTQILQQLSQKLSSKKARDISHVKKCLEQELLDIVLPYTASWELGEKLPWVILLAGINGSGKTTVAAKLAAYYKKEGHRVLLVAGDTFRAAANTQLQIWSERLGVELISHQSGADPAAVAFDALQAASARGHEVVIIDTAGRLHTKKNLMIELEKMTRVLKKVLPEAPQERLLVLDATIGQNSLQQAREFHQAIDITALALTKLDSSAKGGVIVGIINELKLPLKLVSFGEQLTDFQPFNPEAFISAMFADSGEPN